MLSPKRQNKQSGQSLVEFAIVSIVLLLIIFLIVEVSRVMWAWVTVQNAAREGARYAVTGTFDASCLSDTPACEDPRLESIINVVETNLAGLSLNEDEEAAYEDDFAYFIEVYGVDGTGVLRENFAGVAEQPMAVRVIYNVPIIVPILGGIVENIPVMGQVVEYNERFSSFGGTESPSSLAPALPSIPTAGPTPTPTPTPIPTDTPIPTATSVDDVSPTPSNTPTITPSPTPIRCDVQFLLINGNNYRDGNNIVQISGGLNTSVTLYDISVGTVEVGTGEITAEGTDTPCQGFYRFTLSSPLVGNHVYLVESSDGSFATMIPDPAITIPPNTPTQTLAPTDTPTPTPPNTPTHTPTATPPNPFLLISPSCLSGPSVEFTVRGFNWDDSETVIINYGSNGGFVNIPAGHGGAFIQNIRETGVSNADYTIRVESGSGANLFVTTQTLSMPCPNVTATPTAVVTPTPQPADLIVAGAPILQTNPPIVAYEPVSFTVVISNIGDLDVSSQFFIDLYLAPPESAVQPEGIDVAFSNAYQARSQLVAGESQTITINAPFGFSNPDTIDPENVYSMVDSIKQIEEQIETNNVSTNTQVLVTPASTPTPSPTPDGSGTDIIAGLSQILLSTWVPQPRALVFLAEDNGTTQTLLQVTSSELINGAYSFNGVSPRNGFTYQVTACLEVDGQMYVGTRSSINPPNFFANLYMLPSATGCPYL